MKDKSKPPVIGARVRKIRISVIVGALVTIVAGLWLWSRLEWIPAGYVGVIYNASGGIQKTAFTPRRMFVGPFQQLYTYPTRIQAAVYSQSGHYGTVSSDGIQITTSDTATTVFDIGVFYRVKKDDVFTAFGAFGPISIEDIERQHIRRAVRESANAIGTQYDVFQLMGEKRQEASERLTVRLRDSLVRKGITIERAMLLSCAPQGDINSKITARVNSFTQLTISRLLSQIAEISKNTAVIRANAETKSKLAQAATTSGKSLELLELELEEAAIEGWNGQLPQISPGQGQTIIIGDGAIGALKQ